MPGRQLPASVFTTTTAGTQGCRRLRPSTSSHLAPPRSGLRGPPPHQHLRVSDISIDSVFLFVV
uniref:Uncharacterized protein n=1 Tax=Oryza punctata TaxID=4537 RepID=A0A0E0MLT6_ORYPU